MALHLGIKPQQYLYASGFEAVVLEAIMREASELRQTEIQNIGISVANAIARSQKSR